MIVNFTETLEKLRLKNTKLMLYIGELNLVYCS